MNTKSLIFAQITVIALLLAMAGKVLAQGGEVEEVVVSAEYIPDEKLATAQIADILDADDISITGDSNVGEALKRLPGLSLVDGNKLFVRGLGERYSTVYFNGATLPGVTPLSRSVPLDLFDPSVTSNILVEKTYSAKFGAEFSGGAVDIRSAAVPNENFYEFKTSTSYNDISTGESGRGYRGGDTDYLGIDDGTRDIPDLANRLFSGSDTLGSSDFDVATADRIRFSFDNNWDSQETTNEMDLGLSFASGFRWELSDRVSLGLLANGAWSRQFRNRSRQSTDWEDILLDSFETPQIDALGGGQRYRTDFARFGDAVVTDPNSPNFGTVVQSGFATTTDEDRFREEIGLNGFVSVGIDIDNTHEIKLTKMILRLTTDDVVQTRNRRFEALTEAVFEGERLEWAENEIDFEQISSLHIFDFGEVSFRYADIGGSRTVPDRRSVTRQSTLVGQQLVESAFRDNPFTVGDTSDTFEEFSRTDSGRLRIRNADNTNASRPIRAFERLNDSGRNLGMDVVLNFTSDRGFFTDVKVLTGFDFSSSRRKFDSRNFAYQLRDRAFSNAELSGSLSSLLDSSGCEVGGGSNPNELFDNCYLAEGYNGNDGGTPSALSLGALYASNPTLEADLIAARSDFYFNNVATQQAFLEDFRFNNFFLPLSPGAGNSNVTPNSNDLTAITLVASQNSFEGEQETEAFYIELDAAILDSLRFNVGARRERFNVSANTQLSSTSDPIVSELNETGLFPGASLTWKFYRNMQLRFAYSETRNRPILRELVSRELLDPESGRIFRGNPDLQIAEFENFDARYEWYFADNDYLSVSAFKKSITNPIVVTQTNEGGSTRFSWDNREEGVNEGVEFEIEKNFGESWLLTANAAIISSRAPFQSSGALFEEKLPLPGVSRELYNAQVVYKPLWGSVSLAWNKFTRRIDVFALAGENNSVPIYENGRQALDFNIKTKFDFRDGKLNLGLKVTNILGDDFESVYFNGLPFENYEIGRTYSLSLGWKDS